MQTGTTCHNKYINRTPRVVLVAMLAAMLMPLASCVNDNYADEPTADTGTVSVELSIQARSISNITSTSETYVEGTEWENYIDIAGGDFRIYFFTNDKDDKTATSDSEKNTLIAECKPADIYSTEGSNYTTYNISGKVDNAITAYSNFKVVVLANWGTYPTVTAGTTTIDALCSASTAVFNAFVNNGTALMPSSSRLIPFFGIHEYSGVTWKEGERTDLIGTNLEGTITLLRAVAKVEVVLVNDYENSEYDDDITFADVAVVGYNNQGYCAPTGVYLQSDYDHGYTWSEDFVDGLHLVGDANDSSQTGHSFTMNKTTNSDGQETWVCYLPEYDNTSNAGTIDDDDYSYIQVTVSGIDDNNNQYQVDYPLYFANYSSGSTTAYDTEGNTDDRYDIFRNYLYRFTVTVKSRYIIIDVVVNKWDEHYDNVFNFGSEDDAGTGS